MDDGRIADLPTPDPAVALGRFQTGRAAGSIRPEPNPSSTDILSRDDQGSAPNPTNRAGR